MTLGRLIPALVLGVLGTIGCSVPRYSLVVANATEREVEVAFSARDYVAATLGPRSKVGLRHHKPFEAAVWLRGDTTAMLARLESPQSRDTTTPHAEVVEDAAGVRLRVRTGPDTWTVLEPPPPTAGSNVPITRPFSLQSPYRGPGQP
ncbi:MAG: hypothetical protein HBSAPP03_09800 [Phycisphaerae bacterium]|nr:MAG: hypothetical protein HBSAPP03_09800 [Phycisphaerae bacterium]